MSEALNVLAPAKLNLSLRVRSADRTGKHPLRSLAQSIGWYDELRLAPADDDALEVLGADLTDREGNLVWRAVEALRAAGARPDPVAIRLLKRLPVAAGLGGGSSDAAAALIGYAQLTGYRGDVIELAAPLGADVPFCLAGGAQWMEGYGEVLTRVDTSADDYWVALAVPPFELSTPRVYAMWDAMREPEGPELPVRSTPPSLRGLGPLMNDLYPAAVRCNPEVDDWRSTLAGEWDRPVAMSGSGPTLFAFFSDEQEATEAVQLIPSAARNAAAAAPISKGAHVHAG